ncbi:MAG: DUF4832 domain-containing protein [Bacteroidales bacterium]|jgi:hypothetical protein|nr:DUF4832 domain-containing protein [Bacteroidales bacterium]MCI2144954.1 DUF4832 domain-containing protein [Bacteroidales bacterium]
MRFRIVFLLIIFCSAVSCNPKEEPVPVISDTKEENGIVTVTPFEYGGAFRNPMKGWREYFGPGYDTKRSSYPYPFGSIIKEYMQWDKMENIASDGVNKIIEYSDHRWEGVENMNMKVVPRPYIVWEEPYDGGYPVNTYTDNPDDLNGWHWPSDIPAEIISDNDTVPTQGGYFDSQFIPRVKKLVEKLGEAWDNDPRVAYVEMGIIGEWGEQHDPCISTYWAPVHQTEHVAGRTWVPGIEKVLGDAYTAAFKHKKVMVRYAYDFQDYVFGNYWDSFAIDEERERGYNSILKLGDRWKTQPMGGEITWNWGSLYNAGYRSLEDCIDNAQTRQLIINEIRALHTNHLGGVTWADFNDKIFLANASIIQKILGYRYLITEFKYPALIEKGEKFDLSFKVKNTGSSPFYYDWPVEIALLDTLTKQPVWSTVLNDVKITSWLPGDEWNTSTNTYDIPAEEYEVDENISVDEDIPPGRYIISISVLDPAGMLPSLRFAIRNYYTGGRHPIGYTGFGTSIDNYKIDPDDFDDIATDTTLHYIVNK